VRDLAVLFLHLLATIARVAGPGGARSVVAESVLVKHQLLVLNRSRKRSPKLRLSDRMIAGLCALLIRPSRLIRSAIVIRPSTLLRVVFHDSVDVFWACPRYKLRLVIDPGRCRWCHAC
jgi:putative transposase